MTVSDISPGFCQCGCGNKTPIAKASCQSRGHDRGKPLRFIRFHRVKTVIVPAWPETGIPRGLCQCGCGETTGIASKDRPRDGIIKGQSYKYVAGHHTRLSPLEYIEEDRGFATPCHIWQRGLNNKGYGVTTRNGKRIYAHRAFYIDACGPIPEGLEPDHKCKQTACCRFDHLELVTHALNMARSRATKHSMETIEAVRNADPSLTHRAVGALYGVEESYVCRIRRGWIRKGDQALLTAFLL